MKQKAISSWESGLCRWYLKSIACTQTCLQIIVSSCVASLCYVQRFGELFQLTFYANLVVASLFLSAVKQSYICDVMPIFFGNSPWSRYQTGHTFFKHTWGHRVHNLLRKLSISISRGKIPGKRRISIKAKLKKTKDEPRWKWITDHIWEDFKCRLDYYWFKLKYTNH